MDCFGTANIPLHWLPGSVRGAAVSRISELVFSGGGVSGRDGGLAVGDHSVLPVFGNHALGKADWRLRGGPP